MIRIVLCFTEPEACVKTTWDLFCAFCLLFARIHIRMIIDAHSLQAVDHKQDKTCSIWMYEGHCKNTQKLSVKLIDGDSIQYPNQPAPKVKSCIRISLQWF